jgi:hypothetical protein
MYPSNLSLTARIALEGIRLDLLDAVEALKADSDENGQDLSETEISKLLGGVGTYVGKLTKVAQAQQLGMKDQFKVATALLHSYNARFCAIWRAARARGEAVSLAELHALTAKLTVWEATNEPVCVHWLRKADSKGYRPIVVSGRMRTAQTLMLRDVLLMFDIDSAVDFTKKGGGGEKGLIEAICNDIEDEYNWWWTPDIKDCFGSITPRHFDWLPIDRRLIRNIAYLPKCAKIVMVKSEVTEEMLRDLHSNHPDLSEDKGSSSLYALTVQIVRRGLLQGSVLSPLLARAIIGRELVATLSHKEFKRYSYCDDLSIGAKKKGECQAARQALMDRLSSLPAGPIELHDVQIRDARTHRLVVLGYALEAGNGYGDRYVHVKPWLKRINRFKRKLCQKLKAAPAGADLFKIAEEYRVQWFGAQGAWTKVPQFSNRVSQTITMSYVDDFLHSISMGTWQVNKPKLTHLA